MRKLYNQKGYIVDYENRILFEEQFELIHLSHLDSLTKEAIDDINLLSASLERRSHRLTADRRKSIKRRIQFQKELIDRIKYEITHYKDEYIQEFDNLLFIKE